jgi:hypothetical protein
MYGLKRRKEKPGNCSQVWKDLEREKIEGSQGRANLGTIHWPKSWSPSHSPLPEAGEN